VLEEERGKRGLEQRSEHVAVLRQALELVRGNLGAAFEQPFPEIELACDDGARLPRHHVRADLREPSLRELGVPLEQRTGDRQLEDAVTEELEPLVRRRAIGRP
jgi:hypothetical protein